MKKSYILYLLGVLSLQSCSYKTVSFTTHDETKRYKYSIKVPKGYKLVIISGHENEYDFIYKDSSIIFISSDISTGSFVNKEKYIKYGNNIGLEFAIQDTLLLHGIDEKGEYWQESKLKDIIVGYMNIQPSSKEKFDRIISTLKKK